MYERHFGFSVKPFSLTPDPAFLYSSPRHAMALSILEYGLESLAPFSLLTGEIGSGKSLLVGSLIRKYSDQLAVGLINNSHGHFNSINGWVASALGVSARTDSDIAIYEALVDSFVHQYAKGRRTLLIFDEAQNLSIEILEELRLLSNVNSEKDLVLQILLVGQPELRAKLNRPELKQFAQRVSVHFHLTPLDGHETHTYVRHRLQVAGGNPSLFSPEAVDLIYARTRGVPRLVNQLCEFALVYAYADERTDIDADLVTQALNDPRSGFALPPVVVGDAQVPRPATKASEPSRAAAASEPPEDTAASSGIHSVRFFEAPAPRERALVAKLGPRVARVERQVAQVAPPSAKVAPAVKPIEPPPAQMELPVAELPVAPVEPRIAAPTEPAVVPVQAPVTQAEPPVTLMEVAQPEPAAVEVDASVLHEHAPPPHVEQEPSGESLRSIRDQTDDAGDVGQDTQALPTVDDSWQRNREAVANAIPFHRQRRELRRALPVAAAVVMAIGGAAWWQLHASHRTAVAGNPLTAAKSVAAAPTVASAKPAAAQAAAPSVPASASNTAPVTSPTQAYLLSWARTAFSDKKQQLPRVDSELRGDSALELYNQVLVQEPSNEEAREGIQHLFAAGNTRIQGDLSAGKFDDAARIATLFRSGVDADSMREVDAGIAAARPKWMATRARASLGAGDVAGAERLLLQASAAGASQSDVAQLRKLIDVTKHQQQMSALANQVKAAIDTGALLDPAADNASTRLRAMLSVSRTDPLTLREQHDLAAALLDHAHNATLSDQFDVAQRFITAASELGSSSEIASAQQQLRGEMDRVAQRAAAAAAVPADAKPNETLAASVENGGAPVPVRSTEAKYVAARATSLAVVYPVSAADLNVQGSVTVEFTLRPDGKASDVTIVDAKPHGVFENAAIDAVERGRFDTSALNDHPSQRARIKLTFKPKSG
jgi:general secretion pathway protein A